MISPGRQGRALKDADRQFATGHESFDHDLGVKTFRIVDGCRQPVGFLHDGQAD